MTRPEMPTPPDGHDRFVAETQTLGDRLSDLTRAVERLARAGEDFNLRRFSDPSPRSVSIRYPLDTIDPPRLPRHLSWHEKVREKKVSLPAATGWSVLGYVAIELGRLLIEGRLKFW
jgi:hypothetical protein